MKTTNLQGYDNNRNTGNQLEQGNPFIIQRDEPG
jgi:hypothetical protein